MKPERGRAGEDREADGLRFVVQGEARRLLSEEQIEANPARLAEGWERRFIADGARAEEMMRLYRELGFEVLAEPIEPEHVTDECEACWLVRRLHFQMIYTRKREPPARPATSRSSARPAAS